MWIRSALWIGAPRKGAENEFAEAVNHQLLPAIRACPGVSGVSALWPRKLEDDPPQIACQILIEFAQEADIAKMLASPERAEMRAKVPPITALFEGSVSHVNYEVIAQSDPPSERGEREQ
jgi:hypothetical protein